MVIFADEFAHWSCLCLTMLVEIMFAPFCTGGLGSGCNQKQANCVFVYFIFFQMSFSKREVSCRGLKKEYNLSTHHSESSLTSQKGFVFTYWSLHSCSVKSYLFLEQCRSMSNYTFVFAGWWPLDDKIYLFEVSSLDSVW